MWFALVPWLILIKTNNRVILSSALIGAAFFLINLAWLRFVTFSAWFLLSAYLTGLFVVFGFVTGFIIKRFKLPLTVIAPFLWVGLEYLRSFLFTGFPWLYLGHSQYKYLPVIQMADIAGVCGISFLIAVVNAGAAEFALSIGNGARRSGAFYLINAVFPIILAVAAVVYGYSWLSRPCSEDGPVVSVIQGNIPQSVKHDPDESQQILNLQKYVNLSLQTKNAGTDLVVWPETMSPGILNPIIGYMERSVDRLSRDFIKNLAYVLDTKMLIGATAFEAKGGEPYFYNSAFYIDNRGAIIDRYDKINLVPFGEYTPFKRYFPFLAHLVPYEISLSPGNKRVVFDLANEGGQNKPNYKFGVLICYEDTLSSLAGEFCNDGADFLINITNDGWFRDSAELDQHLAIMAFRAVENRTCIIRAANTGISAFVAPNGLIYNILKDENNGYKEVEGVLTDRVRLMSVKRAPWRAKTGDYFALFCAVISVCVFIAALVKKRLFPDRFSKWK